MSRLQSWIAIFVLLGAAAGAGAQTPARAPAQAAPPQAWIPHEVTGVVKSIDNNGTQLTIQTRTGRVIQIDATAAIEARRANISAVGGAVKVQGAFGRQRRAQSNGNSAREGRCGPVGSADR